MKRSIGGAAALLLFAAWPLAAQVTVGVQTNGNRFPFGAYDVTPPNVYQQVYGASAFSGPLTIMSIEFHTWSGSQSPGFSPGNYTIGLSTTSKAVDGLDLNPANNIGPDAQTFFSGFLSGGFVITGTPFHYDPALGNLLLNVVVESQTGNLTNYFASDQEAGDQMSRFALYNNGDDNSPRTDTYGLVTTFNGNAVPEPATMLLLGTGLAAVARGIRRRKTA